MTTISVVQQNHVVNFRMTKVKLLKVASHPNIVVLKPSISKKILFTTAHEEESWQQQIASNLLDFNLIINVKQIHAMIDRNFFKMEHARIVLNTQNLQVILKVVFLMFVNQNRSYCHLENVKIV